MKTDKDTQTWEIKLLTPLHIGDGTELQYNLDYITNSKSIDVIEFDSLLESLSDYPSAINDLSKSIALERLMKDYKINIQPSYSLPFKGNSTPKSIRRFLKNGHGQPFMAGSSLKGAIHTALWATLDRSRLPTVGNYREFSGAVKSLGGKDPYHMFIRPLQISDSIGIEPKGAMNCEEIKFFNLQRENKPGWKDFGTRQTKDKFQETTGLFVECLKPGIKLYLQSRLDPFLNSAPIKQVAKIIECTGLSEFHTLTQTMNAHSLHLATRERTFFSEYRTETARVVNFYDNLIHQIESAGPDSETSFLRLSWGSGWRGMTGDWIDDFTLKEVRIQKRLGKQGVDVFPKTRRLAIDPEIDPEKSVPCLPLGWVRIKQVEKSRFSLTVGPVENNIADVILKPTAPVIPLPPPDPEAEYQAKLAQFKTRVEKIKNFQGEVGALIPIINAQENERLKQTMCKVLCDKANDLPNKAYTKGLKENKNWASSLKTLFEANGG